jgi:hypothetical protein
MDTVSSWSQIKDTFFTYTHTLLHQGLSGAPLLGGILLRHKQTHNQLHNYRILNLKRHHQIGGPVSSLSRGAQSQYIKSKVLAVQRFRGNSLNVVGEESSSS